MSRLEERPRRVGAVPGRAHGTYIAPKRRDSTALKPASRDSEPLTVGLVALAALAYFLSSNPIIAVIGFALGLAFLVYANERAFRYALNNPIPALFSGGQLLEFFRDQRAARDAAIVIESEPVTGAGSDAIEKKGDADA
jgi:hypothetical protein